MSNWMLVSSKLEGEKGFEIVSDVIECPDTMATISDLSIIEEIIARKRRNKMVYVLSFSRLEENLFNTNYKDLLIRYIQLVIQNEGVSYIHVNQASLELSEAEHEELKRLETAALVDPETNRACIDNFAVRPWKKTSGVENDRT